MKTNPFKRLTAAATLAVFVGTQLTGCLTVPNNSDYACLMRNANQAIGAVGGRAPLSASQINTVNQAAQTYGQVAKTATTVAGAGRTQVAPSYVRYPNASYTSADYQQRYSRFKSAKATMEANPSTYTKQQFMSFTTALTDLLVYVDAIEAKAEGLASAQPNGSESWQAFYSESLAYAQPAALPSMPMGSEVLQAQLATAPMVAEYSTQGRVAIPDSVRNAAMSRGSSGFGHPGGPIRAVPCTTTCSKPQQNTSAVKSALHKDLMDLGRQSAFKAFTDPDSPLLGWAARKFTSRFAQDALTTIPVVGNLVSAGMIIAGRNLDGSPMDTMDYATAAVGMLPVVGNLSRALGPGVRILSRELQAVEAVGTAVKNTPSIQRFADLAASDIGELGVDTVTEKVPQWVDATVSEISQKVVAAMPETSAYVEQNNIRI
ncbi:hypothetical protein [Geopseudomonas aromaticivorans]